MNQKRWVALGVAVAIFVFSIISQITTSIATIQSEETSLSFMEMLQSYSDITESIISDGDPSNRIAVLNVSGTIIDSGTSSLFDTETYNHQNFLGELDMIQSDPTVAGVVLMVNSPGGGVYESAQIKERLDAIQQDNNIPIYVSFGSTAASGGYYISAGAEKIFASKETLTGSIGVIMQTYNITGLMEDWGISDVTIKSGEHKDIGSSTRDMTDEEKDILQSMVDNSYDDFVSLIVEGRGMSEEEVRTIADGRIYDGRQAKEVGLIDEFGHVEDAIAAMMEDYDLTDAQVFNYDAGGSFGSLFWAKAQDIFQTNSLTSEQLAKILGTNNSPRLFYLYGE